MPAAAASLLFSAMDADASGAVSFEEMAVGLAVLARRRALAAAPRAERV